MCRRLVVVGVGGMGGLLCAPMSANAGVAALTPVRDTTLYQSDDGTLSNGSGEYLFAGTTAVGLIRRGLIRFDVSAALPPGTVIDSVSLTLFMNRTNTASEPVSLHRVLADWGEAGSNSKGEEGSGTAAEIGDATWLHTFYDQEFWTSPGGDFGAASASILVAGNGFYTWGSTPGMVADVQSWLDGGPVNFGWLLRGDEAAESTAKRFATREHQDPSLRPLLVIEYTPVPAPVACPLLLASAVLAFPRSRGGRAVCNPSNARHVN